MLRWGLALAWVLVGCGSEEAPEPPKEKELNSISVTPHVGCVTTTDGEVWCWRSIEQGDPTNFEKPVRLNGLPRVKSLSFAGSGNYALTEGGEVYALDSRILPGDAGYKAPKRIEGLSRVRSLGLGTFSNYTCALLEDGEVICGMDNLHMNPFPALHGARAVGLFESDFGYALMASGEVRTFRLFPSNKLIKTVFFKDAKNLSVGFSWTCASTETDVACWYSHYSASFYSPVENETTLGPVEQIVLNEDVVCARLAGGEVVCRDGSQGQFQPVMEGVTAFSNTNETDYSITAPILCAIIEKRRVECLWRREKSPTLAAFPVPNFPL